MGRASTVTVTYHGPSSVYRVDFGGDEYPLEAGVAAEVPEALAEQLLDTPDHTFTLGDEPPPEPEPEELEAEEDESSEAGHEVEDLEGVNEDSPYGEE
jgi:hypothetical protein